MYRKYDPRYAGKIFGVLIFALAMGYFESAVVIYLRELIYPEGFAFPLKIIPRKLIIIEVIREAATIVMLLTLAAIAARQFWNRFAYFIFAFGVWDISFYIWLKATINWPLSVWDRDILFLIPSPWIGPVIAPVLISILMIIFGLSIAHLFHKGFKFRPNIVAWILALFGTVAILFSFMHDSGAAMEQREPMPYIYWLLALGMASYILGFWISYRRSKKAGTQ